MERRSSRILLVMEDSPSRRVFRQGLAAPGAAITIIDEPAAARTRFEEVQFGGIIIELSFRSVGAGLDLIRQCRAADGLLPIFAISELDQTMQALGAGADDFLRLPLRSDEFVLRWRGMLARGDRMRAISPRVRCDESFYFGGVEVRANLMLRFPNGAEEPIRPKQLEILRMFAGRGGELVLRDDLTDAIWGFKAARYGSSSNQYISLLRAAFRRHGLDFDRWVTCV